jgi:hypothetical protein
LEGPGCRRAAARHNAGARGMRKVLYPVLIAAAILVIISAGIFGVGEFVNAVFAPLIEFALRIFTLS